MIYAYDQAVQMPVVDLYDTQMMAMAINAAKDVYDKNLDSIKELRKQTGDFWSPTQSHMDFYNKEFNVGQFLDSMYEQGIDPLRSKEGQMLVQRYINSRPYAKLNNMKKSAEAYELYEKNKAQLAKENRFNQAFEDYVTGGKNIRDLGVDEVWDRISPIQYQDLNEYAGHIFDKMEDSFIESDPETGLDWYGVNRDRRAEALTPQLGGLLSSPLGQFHYEQSRKNAEYLLGRPATEKEVLDQFKNDILTATKEYDHRNFKENAEYKRNREFKYAAALDNIRTANDIHAQTTIHNINKANDQVPIIFREAAAYPGQEVGYDVESNPTYQWMDPVIKGARVTKGNGGNYGYTIPASQVNKIYKKGAVDRNGNKISAINDYRSNSDASFVSTGQMRMDVDENGNPHYWITGTLVNNTTGKNISSSEGTNLYEMEVTERDYNYGRKQTSEYKPTN